MADNDTRKNRSGMTPEKARMLSDVLDSVKEDRKAIRERIRKGEFSKIPKEIEEAMSL